MGISTIAGILITIGAILLILGTIPVENKLEGDTLTVRFIFGKKHSGNFMNTRTRAKYMFYLTGKGEKTYFEIGKDKYLVDGLK